VRLFRKLALAAFPTHRRLRIGIFICGGVELVGAGFSPEKNFDWRVAAGRPGNSNELARAKPPTCRPPNRPPPNGRHADRKSRTKQRSETAGSTYQEISRRAVAGPE